MNNIVASNEITDQTALFQVFIISVVVVAVVAELYNLTRVAVWVGQ